MLPFEKLEDSRRHFLGDFFLAIGRALLNDRDCPAEEDATENALFFVICRNFSEKSLVSKFRQQVVEFSKLAIVWMEFFEGWRNYVKIAKN
jgi:hypothetical protein